MTAEGDGSRGAARGPLAWVLALFVVALLAGSWWNLPCTDAWSNDEVSPRASTLAAVFETWTPGHFFRYPPLHVLLLTVLQAPVVLAAALRAGFGVQALGAALIDPAYMSVSCVIGRVVALVMACGVVINLYALWSRLASPRAGVVAAALAALNPVVVYFGHTASVDVPYWFWTTRAMLELDRVAAGEDRARHAMLLCAAALLTKDQSAFLLVGALVATCVLVPWARVGARAVWDPRLLRAALMAAGVYLLVSGALVNPTGFRRRLAWMTGEGNAGWTLYDRTTSGALAQLRDIVLSTPRFGTWLVAAGAAAGLLLSARGVDRALALRRAAPALAALFYLALFVVPSRWTMERHLCPLALMLFPYAYFALSLAPRPVALALAGVALAPMARDVASVDATLIVDAREAVTRRLEALPAGTRVEVYGGNQYLPRLPSHLALTRVGPEPIDARSPLPGVVERVAPFMEIAARAPSFAVVGEDFAQNYLPTTARRSARSEALARDPDGSAFFRGLVGGTLGYRWALRARCELPRPLRCVRMHLSTGAESWLFERAR